MSGFAQLLLIPLLFGCTLLFAKPTAETSFQDGVSAYQKNNLEEAKSKLTEFLQKNPNHPQALFNLGLVEYKSERKGYAIALWRKALFISPFFSKAQQALDYAEKNFGGIAFRQKRGNWTLFLNTFVHPVPADLLYGISIFLALLSGFLLLRFWGKRRRALQNETPMPNPPFLAAGLAVLFFFFAFVSGTKTYHLLLRQGIIITKSVDIRTGPNMKENALLELLEGSQVTILQKNKDWLLVEHQEEISGWIPADSLLQTHGLPL